MAAIVVFTRVRGCFLKLGTRRGAVANRGQRVRLASTLTQLAETQSALARALRLIAASLVAKRAVRARLLKAHVPPSVARRPRRVLGNTLRAAVRP